MLVIVACGLALGVGLAIVASPLMPVGPVRRLLAGNTVDIDATVLLIGGATFALALGAAVVCLTIVGRPERRSQMADRTRSRGVSRLTGWAVSSGLPVPAVIGIRAAFDRPDGANPVPNRSVVVGTAMALAAVVGALTFAAGLSGLVHTPRMFGWGWDAKVLAGNGYDNIDPARSAAIMGADPALRDSSGAYFGVLAVDGMDVSVLGMDPSSAVTPPIVAGRMVRAKDEIVLGAATAAQLGKHTGDTVDIHDANGAVQSLRIVGTAIFPANGRVHTEHVTLGTGAIVVPDLVPGRDFDILGQPQTGLGPHVVFVRFVPGTRASDEFDHLRETTRPLSGFAGLGLHCATAVAERAVAGDVDGRCRPGHRSARRHRPRPLAMVRVRRTVARRRRPYRALVDRRGGLRRSRRRRSSGRRSCSSRGVRSKIQLDLQAHLRVCPGFADEEPPKPPFGKVRLYVDDMRNPVRTAALGGVVGPAGFIGAWVLGAAVTSAPYSSIDDAISRLAAVGSDTRWLMTAGFVTFGLSLPVYATALRATVPGPAWMTAAATGVATLAVAAAPLDRSEAIDRLHGIFAGIGYLTLAATPLLAVAPLRGMGHYRLARSGIAAGLTSMTALALTTTGLRTGLFQRVGLTVSDAWIIATALTVARGARVNTGIRSR